MYCRRDHMRRLTVFDSWALVAFLLIMILSLNTLTAGEADSTKLLSDQPVKSPKGAMIRSMLLPGWGQVYTDSYIKGSLFFATNAAFFSRMLIYNNRYNDARKRTDILLASEPSNSGAITMARNDRVDARDKRGQSAWFLGLAYTLCMIDAYVNAGLYKFDDMMEVSVLPAGTDGSILAVQFRF